MKEVVRNPETGRYLIRFRFGGAEEAVWNDETGWEDARPAATPEQFALYLAHRLSGTSPGDPAWYRRLKSQRHDFGLPVGYLKFRPGAKPVLPAGVSRLEDLEGYLPDDPEASPA
jgi:hypothetical protein